MSVSLQRMSLERRKLEYLVETPKAYSGLRIALDAVPSSVAHFKLLITVKVNATYRQLLQSV